MIREKIKRILDMDDDGDIPIVLAGNKADLENERKVPRSDLEKLKSDWGCAVFETSAKEKMNIDEAFFQVVREIRKRKEKDNVGGNGGGGSGKKGGFCNIL